MHRATDFRPHVKPALVEMLHAHGGTIVANPSLDSTYAVVAERVTYCIALAHHASQSSPYSSTFFISHTTES
jgi:hypothetical protein